MKVFGWRRSWHGPPWLASALLVLVGLAIVVAGSVAWSDTRGFLDHGVAATAVVVDVERHETTRHDSQDDRPITSVSYRAVVRYDAGDSSVTSTLPDGNSARPTMGAAIDVVYDARHPERVRRDGALGIWGLAGTLLGLGTTMLLAGVASGAWLLRRRRRSRSVLDHTAPAISSEMAAAQRERGQLVRCTVSEVRGELDVPGSLGYVAVWGHDEQTGERYEFVQGGLPASELAGINVGGAIHVYMQPGRLDRFWIDLPQARGAA